jgi:hypothetical protein
VVTGVQTCALPIFETSNATAFPLHESWIDLGRHEDLLRARQEHDQA